MMVASKSSAMLLTALLLEQAQSYQFAKRRFPLSHFIAYSDILFGGAMPHLHKKMHHISIGKEFAIVVVMMSNGRKQSFIT